MRCPPLSPWKVVLTLGLVLVLTRGVAVAQEASPDNSGGSIRSLSDRVLLDVIVRGDDGHPLRDLLRGDFRVLEDGVDQEILSLRWVDAGLVAAENGRSHPTPAGWPPRGDGNARSFSARPGLVCLVFEQLSSESRTWVRSAALEAASQIARAGLYGAVFVSGERLLLLQEFTRDEQRLREAVERATTRPQIEIEDYAASITQTLQDRGEIERTAQALLTRGSNVQLTGSLYAQAQSLANEYTLVTMALRILQTAQFAQDSSGPQRLLHALLALVRGQGQLVGRKSVLYFTEGWDAPYNAADLLASLISEANRAQVSFYAVDSRGLSTQASMRTALETLTQAVEVSRGQLLSTSPGVTRDQVFLSETGENAIRQNRQGNLANLAASTGGVLVANSNDIAATLRQAILDLSAYYELSYRPTNRVFDGRFRSIAVEVKRPRARVQARRGYFALPPTAGLPFEAFETPLLAALEDSSASATFEYHARLLPFGRSRGGTHFQLVLELPLSSLTFVPTEDGKHYQAHFSLLGLLRSEEGEIIHRFSRDYPLEGPWGEVQSQRRGSLVYLNDFDLPPGGYHLETAVLDVRHPPASVRRSAFVVVASSGPLQVSPLCLVRRLDPRPADATPADPLLHGEYRVIPQLSERLADPENGAIPVFLKVAYAAPAAEHPQVTLDLFHNGVLIAAGQPFQGRSLAAGLDSVLAAVVVPPKGPGRYEIRARVSLGRHSVERYAFFAVAAP